MFSYDAQRELLKGRIILVTGAGTGIGRDAALSFAQYGATVILLGRTLSSLESVYDEIEKKQWPQAAIYPMDLLSASDTKYRQLVDTLAQEFGRLDGLLHNAAVMDELRPLVQTDTACWLKTFQVNLNAAFMMTRELLPLLRESDGSSVVFTTDSQHIGQAFSGAYGVSKKAVEVLMQTFSEEEEGISSVRFNCINPGKVNTTLRRSTYPGEVPESLLMPIGIMPLYLYLMGYDSKDISGSVLNAQD
ncbi:putative oxidoreductase YciK [invertebrate metagenome]|uniref:Putative oxidoreductase YciK n=1 Tax=invertebrate metagenome TaxID=1711999 RepID=A0A2H9TAP3_9ZZZZ